MTSPRLLFLSVDEVAALTALDVRKHPGEVKAGGADRNRGNAEELRRYWTVGAGGAKIRWGTSGDFTRCVRLLSEHMTPERAKGYCANRHREMTGMWPGDKDNKGYDPELEVVKPPVTGKGYPRLPGSHEERQDALMGAVVEALRGDLISEEDGRWEWPGICIDATFDDRVIATRHKYDGTDEHETFEMTYEFNIDGGVDLGAPDKVDLQVVAVNVEDTDDAYLGDALPLVEGVYNIAHAVKTAHAATVESKAGQVLSGANQRALQAAVENLVEVLRRAGLRISVREEDDERPGDPVVPKPMKSDQRETPDPDADPGTTSPTARGVKSLDDGGLIIDADAFRQGLEAFRG